MTSLMNIMDIFETLRMSPLSTDQYYPVGRNTLISKLLPFFNNKQPLSFVMLGLPFKSINDRDKVLGKLPDLGEKLMIENFGNFNNQIKNIYSPGIEMNIVSDGFVFNDLMDVFDSTVHEYKELNEDLSRGLPIRIYDLCDFYNHSGRLVNMREKLVDQFGISDVELERRILVDTDVQMLYKGMIHFMEGDLAIHNYDSRNQLHKAAKKLAREMMLRNEAYSALVHNTFSNHVRLSMHPSINNGAKYSIQLIPGKPERIWTSPWHSAILWEKDGYSTIHKKDAVDKGYELVNVHNQPYYFVNNDQ